MRRGSGTVNVPRFSLIIPAYNEAAYLPRLLDTVDVARKGYRGGPDAIEVIVSDNASTDGTGDIASRRGCKVASVEKRCIAAARNGGAALARGEVLCFTDADMQIHPETFNVIDDAVKSGKYVAGATGVHLERMSLGPALSFAMMVPPVWMMRMDTGVVFCKREDFDAVGSYNEDMQLAEDVRFLMNLRRRGRKTGRRLARLTAAKSIASVRKFDEHGEWHYFKLMFTVAIWPLVPTRQQESFMNRYWYGRQREPGDRKD